MAKLLCELHWDATAKKVVKTYQVLSTGPTDTVQLITRDSEPFIIQSKDAQLAKQLGLDKAPNAKGPGLYQVKKAAPPPKTLERSAPTPPRGLPSWLKLKCGTLDKDGQLLSWGGLGPDGF